MIIGASGSGKSVMLKCIVGLMKPSNGEVLYDGLEFHTAGHKDVRNLRTNMGMLFQYSALFDYMTVEENIAFPMKLFTKWTRKAIAKRVAFCLDRVTMTGTNKLYPAELSGGMMKRVGIARAIALNPKYLFVDEPNSGLDPLTASVIDELIMEITYEYNMCTVVVSHDMNSVLNISDNILFLFNGLKEWTGTKREILRSGNPNLDKFVFVSDLIRRDVYDEEEKPSPAPPIVVPPVVEAPIVEPSIIEAPEPPSIVLEKVVEESQEEVVEQAAETASPVLVTPEESLEQPQAPTEETILEELSLETEIEVAAEEAAQLDTATPAAPVAPSTPVDRPLSRAEAEAKLNARLAEIASQSVSPETPSEEASSPAEAKDEKPAKDKSSKKKKKKKKDKGKL
ncbi:UNVERIFIED_CONTAM: hypothetical protein GTU68_030986 [Idotea baltica]|nr:hypothetical protein [Idotea baltica]